MLTEQEKFLWEQMDGRASLQEIATAYVLRYGAFDFETIPALIAKLRRAELLTMRPASRLREVLARNQKNPAARAAEAALHALEKLTVTSRRSHERLRARCTGTGASCSSRPRPSLVLAVLVAARARGAPSSSGATAARYHGTSPATPLVAILLVKLFFWLTVISHQIVHALACVHYGRRVREFGFTMLHGFIPTFYADVTDIFMGSRRARIVAALSGPLVHLFLGTLYLWTASFPGPGLLKAFLAASAILQLQSLLRQPLSVLLPRDGRLPRPRGPARLPHAEPRLRPLRARVPRPAPDAASAAEPPGGRLRRLLRAVAPLHRGLRPAELWCSCTPAPDRAARRPDLSQPPEARAGRDGAGARARAGEVADARALAADLADAPLLAASCWTAWTPSPRRPRSSPCWLSPRRTAGAHGGAGAAGVHRLVPQQGEGSGSACRLSSPGSSPTGIPARWSWTATGLPCRWTTWSRRRPRSSGGRGRRGARAIGGRRLLSDRAAPPAGRPVQRHPVEHGRVCELTLERARGSASACTCSRSGSTWTPSPTSPARARPRPSPGGPRRTRRCLAPSTSSDRKCRARLKSGRGPQAWPAATRARRRPTAASSGGSPAELAASPLFRQGSLVRRGLERARLLGRARRREPGLGAQAHRGGEQARHLEHEGDRALRRSGPAAAAPIHSTPRRAEPAAHAHACAVDPEEVAGHRAPFERQRAHHLAKWAASAGRALAGDERGEGGAQTGGSGAGGRGSRAGAGRSSTSPDGRARAGPRARGRAPRASRSTRSPSSRSTRGSRRVDVLPSPPVERDAVERRPSPARGGSGRRRPAPPRGARAARAASRRRPPARKRSRRRRSRSRRVVAEATRAAR